MKAALALLRERGVIDSLDRELALALTGLGREARPSVALALALASRQTQAGHVCVKLPIFAGQPIVDETGEAILHDGVELCWPELQSWLHDLQQSPLVGDGRTRTPLVLLGPGHLYLYRYWEHEQRASELLKERLFLDVESVDKVLLNDGLARLFAPAGRQDRQRDAALIASVSRLAVIVGGPGTGKTSTVARILTLLIEQYLYRERRAPTTLLLAPTGKAAARLVDSIRSAKHKLDCSAEVRDAIVEQASTIHRALGSRRGSSTQFYHHRGHPLLADLVLVDEASMVDVALMRRLLEALPRHARLILLGDKHQLASVEAGSVLSDICGRGEHPGYASDVVRAIERLTSFKLEERDSKALTILDSVVELTKSYRFSDESGIGRFAAAVNRGDAQGALDLALGAPRASELCLVRGEGEELLQALEQQTVQRYRERPQAADPHQALTQLNEYRVLCAHREGPLGVHSVNQRLQHALARAGLIKPYSEWYPGRPILIVSNDHHLKLFNGDVGLILRDENGALKAFFDAGGGEIRSLSASRLPPHETVFAMSIHKSQGSEFTEVSVVLPRPSSPLLTRELLYTAVTRARKRATLYGQAESIAAAVVKPIARASGLDALLHRSGLASRNSSANGS